MKIKFFVFLTFCCFSFLSWSQFLDSAQGGNDSRLNDAFTSLRNSIQKSSNDLSSVSGSPHLSDKFINSEVIYFGKKLKDKIFLRYNAYNDEVEMAKSSEQSNTEDILIKNSSVSCIIEGIEYRYLPYPEKRQNFPKAGYVQVLFEGKNVSLYKKNRKIFMEAKKARTSLERSFPARYVDEAYYLYNTKGKPLKILKLSKSDIKKAFETSEKSMANYLKKNKPNLKNSEDLVDLFSFIDKRGQ